MLQPWTVKRDLWRLTDPRIGGRAPGSSGARRVAQYIADRFEANGLKPGFSGSFRQDLGQNIGEMICGVRQGSGDQAVVVIAMDPGIGILSALPVAGLISLASTFDAPDAPMHSMHFCVLPAAGGLTGFATRGPVAYQYVLESFTIGTLTGGRLQDEAGPALGPVRSVLLHSGPLPADMSEDIGQLDYDMVIGRLNEIYSRLSSID